MAQQVENLLENFHQSSGNFQNVWTRIREVLSFFPEKSFHVKSFECRKTI
jgi:hypothetical protein